MEEQKNNGKEVKMQPVNGGNQGNNQEKISYEKLTDIANNLFSENRYLKQQLQQANEALRTINRLDYLLKIVELANNAGTYKFNSDFVVSSVEEIEKIMTPPLEEEKTEDSKKN